MALVFKPAADNNVASRQKSRRTDEATERDPGQDFINWVLGYGYAAGHWTEPQSRQPDRAGQAKR
jgi:hypothetical protein